MKALRFLLPAIIVFLIYHLRAHVGFRFYPVVMAALALGAFATSLFRTPLVEKIARKRGNVLDTAGVAYCRRVTEAWTLFLALNFAVTVWTVFASYEIWALYNGIISYALMGVMFFGEMIFRKRFCHG